MIHLDDDIKRALVDGGKGGHAGNAVRGDPSGKEVGKWNLFDLIVVGLYRDATRRGTSCGLEHLIGLWDRYSDGTRY